MEIAKKTQLLLQIASSGLKVEEVMEEHASELDFACVRLMEKRIEAAYRQGPLPCPACCAPPLHPALLAQHVG